MVYKLYLTFKIIKVVSLYKKMKTGIYKITNPKGKVYVGQSIDIEKRWKKYLSKKFFESQVKIYRSILKYGEENHVFEILEICDKEELDKRERFWQEEYNCVEKGLNCIYTQTSDKAQSLSIEMKIKMSESAKLKISKNPDKYKFIGAKGVNNNMYNKKGDSHHFFGKNQSEESIDKIRKASIGNSSRSKKVLDKSTGIEYKSLKEACELLKLSYKVQSQKLNNYKEYREDQTTLTYIDKK